MGFGTRPELLFRHASLASRSGSPRAAARYHVGQYESCDNHRQSQTQARTVWSARSASGLPGDAVNLAAEARHKIHSDGHSDPGRADEQTSNGCVGR